MYMLERREERTVLGLYALSELNLLPDLLHLLLEFGGPLLEDLREFGILLRAFSTCMHLRNVGTSIGIAVLAGLQRVLVGLDKVLLYNAIDAAHVKARKEEAGLLRLLFHACLVQHVYALLHYRHLVVFVNLRSGNRDDARVRTADLIVQLAAFFHVAEGCLHVGFAAFTFDQKQ